MLANMTVDICAFSPAVQPLAQLTITDMWLSYTMGVSYSMAATVCLPTLSIHDLRPGVAPDQALVLSSTDAAKVSPPPRLVMGGPLGPCLAGAGAEAINSTPGCESDARVVLLCGGLCQAIKQD
jgi:hypothetical protein